MSNKESVGKTFIVAGILCVVCSAIVSIAVVSLRDKQLLNIKLDKRSNILSAAGVSVDGIDINKTYETSIDVKYIDISTGEYLDSPPSKNYDSVVAAKLPEFSEKIPPAKDLGDIKRRAKFSEVYLLKDDTGSVSKIILPIRGKGLWSTMKGFAAVDNVGQSISGLTFYSHGETAGLGGEVDNPAWKAKWPGKKIYDENGSVKLTVIKGNVAPGSLDEAYQVDGLAGATITSRGVSNLIAYWFGPDGYKTYLSNLGGRYNGKN